MNTEEHRILNDAINLANLNGREEAALALRDVRERIELQERQLEESIAQVRQLIASHGTLSALGAPRIESILFRESNR